MLTHSERAYLGALPVTFPVLASKRFAKPPKRGEIILSDFPVIF